MRGGLEWRVQWRSICLILLLVANFQWATVVQAQTDHSFSRWLDARERLAKELAAEMGISVETAIARIRKGVPNKYSRILYKSEAPTTTELRQADLKQYEKDKAEATDRGISFDEVFTEREARAQLAEAKFAAEFAAEKAEAEKRKTIQMAVAATIVTIVIVVIVIVFRARRRIAASFSRKWRGKSEAFRAWAFGSISWAVGMFLFVWLFDPYYTDGWAEYLPDFLHLLGVMILPPLFLGAVWFGYKRFVK